MIQTDCSNMYHLPGPSKVYDRINYIYTPINKPLDTFIKEALSNLKVKNVL